MTLNIRPKNKYSFIFLLIGIGCFFSNPMAFAQLVQEQAKVQYYKAMVEDESLDAQQRLSYYDSICLYSEQLKDFRQVREYNLKKMHLYYQLGLYIETYQTGLSVVESLNDMPELTEKELEEKNLTHLTIARASRNLGLFDEGISHLFSIIRNPDPLHCVEAYSFLGLIFMQMGQMEQSKQYNDEAIKMLNQVDRTVFHKKASIVYNNFSGYQYNINQLDSALHYLNLSIEYYDTAEYVASKSYRYNNMGIIYQEMGEYGMAEDYYRRAVEGSVHEPYNLARYLQNLAFVLTLSGRLKEAEDYYYQALEIAEEAEGDNVKSSILIELSDIYYQKKQYQKSLDLLKEGFYLRDSIFGEQNMEKISLLSQQFDNYKISTEKALVEQELQLARFANQKKNVVVGFLIIVLIAVSILTYFQVKRIRKNIAADIREGYETSLSQSNRELASNALILIKANEALISLDKCIKKLAVIKDAEKQKEIVHEMETISNSYNVGQGWKEFKLYFEQVHPSFYANLNEINPNLSKMEQRLSALLVLNMNTKEIADLTNRSVRTIEAMIYRLRKSLDIPPAEKTTQFLRQFL